MRPDDIRDRISREHVQIRILACTVDADCRRVLDGGSARLRDSALALTRALWDHLTVEDRLLVPELRKLDAWGPVRAERIAEEHARQREELANLAQLARSGPSEELAARTRCLIAVLREDMDAEERDLLSPELWREDCVVVDQLTG
jgi:hypothetical protein